MYINSGYLHNSRIAFVDKTRPLIVGSCGTYRLSSHYRLPTWWKNGRIDWQLLYIASGTDLQGRIYPYNQLIHRIDAGEDNRRYNP